MNIELAADPTWEPMSFADVLDQDGCYHGIIVAEKPTSQEANKPGIWITIELQDADVRGKRLQKMLPDVSASPKSAFIWRGLIMSAMGKEAARQSFRYQEGVFQGWNVYVKTGAYESKDRIATGIDEWLVKADYDQAVAKNAHRWPRKVEAKASSAGVFGLPTGLPTGFGSPVTPPGGVQVPGAAVATAQPSPVPQPPKAGAFPSFPGLGK